ASLQRDDLPAALKHLQSARNEAPEASPEIEALGIELALEGERVGEALERSASAVQRWPQRQALALLRAGALQRAGRDGEAVQFLKQRIGKWPDLPELHQRLAFSEDRQGNAVAARRAMARYYELVGAFPTAVEQLTQARGLTNDFYVQSELDTRIRQLKDRLQ